MSSDILDRLAVYAPTPTSVAGEWGPAQREQGLAAVLDSPAGPGHRLRFVPGALGRPGRAVAPIAASVAVLVLAGGAAVLTGRESATGPATGPGSSAAPQATGTSTTDYRATVGTPRLASGQWAYRTELSFNQAPGPEGSAPTAHGKSFPSAVWVAIDGSGQSRDNGGDGLTCRGVAAVHDARFDEPTQQFVDGLPDDPAALKDYLVKHVNGSTSLEEAIFVTAGDLLQAGDLLASSGQRAALVTVLAGLGRTSVHDDVDAKGRAAVRVDFVDPNQRASEIQSLYFDPRTFQLLEKRSSDPTPSQGVPTDEPSAPYTSVPSTKAGSPQQLPESASIQVMTAERVVDTLPENCGIAK